MLIAIALSACGGRSKHTAVTPPPPPTTVAATTTTTIPPVSYTVKRGDTLSAIAKRYKTTVDAVVAFNDLANPNQLKDGQTILIPPAPLPPPSTTSTVAPSTTAPPPAKLAVGPGAAGAGTMFNLDLSGARPGETVTFEVDSPAGKKYTGPPHTASPTGAVSTVYGTISTDPAGTYTVVATGNLGTSARTTFVVNPPKGQ